jgi:xanthine dehydrogenase YagS FAD-binding subunit
MRPFCISERATDASAAVQALAAADNNPLTEADPAARRRHHADRSDEARRDAAADRVDINPLRAHGPRSSLEAAICGLARWRGCPMSPTIRESAQLSRHRRRAQARRQPQLRNMASLGGNVLQRTRCTYFRDVSYDACNKRNPGLRLRRAGRLQPQHAVLGTADQCIATYPGDFAQALIALDATVEITGKSGIRAFRSRNCTSHPGIRRRSRRRWRRAN